MDLRPPSLLRPRPMLGLRRAAALIVVVGFAGLSVGTSQAPISVRTEGQIVTHQRARPRPPGIAFRLYEGGQGFLETEYAIADKHGRFSLPGKFGGWGVGAFVPGVGVGVRRSFVETHLESDEGLIPDWSEDRQLETTNIELWHRGLAEPVTCGQDGCTTATPEGAIGALVAIELVPSVRVLCAGLAPTTPQSLPPGFEGTVFAAWHLEGAPLVVTEPVEVSRRASSGSSAPPQRQ